MTTKIRTLLLDNETGLIPRIKAALQSDNVQNQFQLKYEGVPDINFFLGNARAEFPSEPTSTLRISQTICLKVQVLVTEPEFIELQILSAQFQAAIDVQITHWFLQHQASELLHSISEATGAVTFDPVEGDGYSPLDVSKTKMTVERNFEFEYFG